MSDEIIAFRRLSQVAQQTPASCDRAGRKTKQKKEGEAPASQRPSETQPKHNFAPGDRAGRDLQSPDDRVGFKKRKENPQCPMTESNAAETQLQHSTTEPGATTNRIQHPATEPGATTNRIQHPATEPDATQINSPHTATEPKAKEPAAERKVRRTKTELQYLAAICILFLLNDDRVVEAAFPSSTTSSVTPVHNTLLYRDPPKPAEASQIRRHRQKDDPVVSKVSCEFNFLSGARPTFSKQHSATAIK
ncbi:hypothetical protein H6P81_020659 [Aristolochia fimbriata]|uniref:Uncharacterized protein n=1 Tax=Aristolochia fimbriata TaxID=158543 RepID=A0AAV7DVC6_ARIFI|nr:hypothetical protein H6P81_020659 [Aristolochia fimbriata]